MDIHGAVLVKTIMAPANMRAAARGGGGQHAHNHHHHRLAASFLGTSSIGSLREEGSS